MALVGILILPKVKWDVTDWDFLKVSVPMENGLEWEQWNQESNVVYFKDGGSFG